VLSSQLIYYRKSLGDDDAHALLQNLIGWLIRCLENGEGALVVRKLCSTLVAYFLQFSMSWTRCVRHLLYCFCKNQAVPYHSLAEAPDTPILIENLSGEKAIVIFWFAATLVDEVGKTDSSSMKQLSGFNAPSFSFHTDKEQTQVSSASGAKCYRYCASD
jgi:hypothetical protein